jgi:pimeloyl-ACP methyl ester carboxylesterase
MTVRRRDGVPGAGFVEVSDASHGVTIQRAEQINTLLREHLTRTEALRHS